ncbi:MAG: PKD domain-containing protein [Flavobacteriales bacterium]
MRPTLFLLVSCLAVVRGLGQSDIWYFGDQAGLDFSSGTPVALNDGASYSLDNSTTASDTLGNLLFYSNGFSVWDANHTVMPNGSGLLGSNNSGQCALAVHRPSTNEYFLFTVDQWNGSNGLRYSVVDMALNGGLGDVTVKNQLLQTPTTERLEAVRNPLDGSWWVITHDWNSAQFRVFNLAAAGLNIMPVLSTVGATHSGNNYDAAGQLTASRSGSLLACGIYDQNQFEVFDFDNTTGVVSNARQLPGYLNAWGCAFSSDNTKLYLTKWYNNEVIQLDLSAGSWANVQASALLVGNTTGNVNGWQAGFLQLGPDDRIYVAKFGQSTLGVITSPNAGGLLCGFVDNGVSLGSGLCNAGLCRTPLPDAPTCALSIDLPPLNGCAWSPITVPPQLGGTAPETWYWDFGDGTTSTAPGTQEHTYFSEGLYQVTIIVGDSSGLCSDTTQALALIGAPETAGADTSVLLCTTDAPINLNDLLSAYADVNGMWTDALGVPVSPNFDPAVDPPGSYQYVISGVHCGPDSAWFVIGVQICMATGEVTSDDPLGLFPIPAHETLWITLPSDRTPTGATLFDVQGRTVLSAALAGMPGGSYAIDLGGLGPGTYLLRLKSNDGHVWQRSFVKSE